MAVEDLPSLAELSIRVSLPRPAESRRPQVRTLRWARGASAALNRPARLGFMIAGDDQ
jgi:hypothetical protein